MLHLPQNNTTVIEISVYSKDFGSNFTCDMSSGMRGLLANYINMLTMLLLPGSSSRPGIGVQFGRNVAALHEKKVILPIFI